MLNNYQWSNKRGQPKGVGGTLEVHALTLLTVKVDAVTQRLDGLTMNAVTPSAPSQ